MKVPIVVVFVPFLCWSHPVESNTFSDFFVNIPKQIGHAWDTLIEVIKEPVRIRIGKQGRTTTRSPKAVILVHEGISDLRADSAKEAQEEKRKMPAPSTLSTPTTVTSSWKTTMPFLAQEMVHDKQQKLIIPIIKPITYTEWATFPRVIAITEKSQKFSGRFNEDFQKPFKEFVEYSFTSPQTIRTMKTIPPWRKIRIPVVLEPKYITVNDWNNLQRPMFAQIHQIAKGSTQSTLSKIMNYYYTDSFYKTGATEPCYSKIRHVQGMLAEHACDVNLRRRDKVFTMPLAQRLRQKRAEDCHKKIGSELNVLDAFKSSWRVITQGSSEQKRTTPPRGMTEGPLWIKIPKRDGSKKPQKTRIDGAEPLKSQINFKETDRSSSLQDVTEWFSTLVSPKINIKKHRTGGRRIKQEPETKLRIPFFTPPKPNYKYLMRTVLWRTPRDAATERIVDTKGMAGAVNVSVSTVIDASPAPTRVAYTLVTMETTNLTKNHTGPEIRFFFKRFRFNVFNKLEVN